MSKKYPQSRRFSPSEGMKTDFGTTAEERTFCSETRRESRRTSPVRKAKRRREESTSSESRSGSGGRAASSCKKRRGKDDRKRRKRKQYSRSRSESTCKQSSQVYDSSSDESDSSTRKGRKSKHKKAKSKKKRKKEKKKAPKKQKLKKKMKVEQENNGAGQGKETSGTSENTSAGNVSRAMPTKTQCKDITAPAKGRTMIPMTKEEYEKQQSLIRRVYDPETGRNRLIRGDGEILEEIVSMERHKAINKAATHGDGAFFQASLGLSQR